MNKNLYIITTSNSKYFIFLILKYYANYKIMYSNIDSTFNQLKKKL